MAQPPRAMLPLDRASPGLREALEEARRLGGSHGRPAATCALPDGRRFSAVLWEGDQLVQIEQKLLERADGGNGHEPAGAEWEPSPLEGRGIQVQVVKRDRGRRIIRVTGGVDATVDYNAHSPYTGDYRSPKPLRNGGGTVLVDGVEAGALRGSIYVGVYSLEFDLPCGKGVCTATIRVTLGEWLAPRIGSLRLTVGDIKVYEEVAGKVTFIVGLSDLPIPATCAEQDRDTLPVPSDPGPDVP